MAILTDYFAAQPAEVEQLNLVVGPRGGTVPASSQKKGLFGRRRTAEAEQRARSFDTVQSTGLEPTVTMATLEEILTGNDSMQIIDEADLSPVVELDPRDGPWVFRLRAEVQAALASDSASLDDVALRWSQTEELEGSPVEDLRSFLSELTALARRAQETKSQLFCWVSL